MLAPSNNPLAPPNPGLCADCVHSRRVQSDRGSLFFFCQLSLTEESFAKYPRLPVISCRGYRRKADEPGETDG
jgi:hypothetical protein